jgi:hypothetical protein
MVLKPDHRWPSLLTMQKKMKRKCKHVGLKSCQKIKITTINTFLWTISQFPRPIPKKKKTMFQFTLMYLEVPQPECQIDRNELFMTSPGKRANRLKQTVSNENYFILLRSISQFLKRNAKSTEVNCFIYKRFQITLRGNSLNNDRLVKKY